MASRLIGGPALRARLENVATVGPAFAGEWAEDAAKMMRQDAPPSTRPRSKVFEPRANERRGGVFGAFWWIFVDRGTKAHDISGMGRRNPPTILRFERGNETIFARQVHKKRQRRRPFITRAAQEALSGSRFAELVIQSWNGRKIRGPHKAFL